MIIKIGIGEERGEYKGYQYIEGCESVRIKRTNLNHITYKYQAKLSCASEEQYTDLQDFVKNRLKRVFNSAGAEDKCDSCDCDEDIIFIELKKVIEWTFEEFQMEIEGEDLKYLVKCLCGEEKFNIDGDDARLNAVYYKKGDKTYVIYSIYNPIYLLNNEGKTIDIIR